MPSPRGLINLAPNPIRQAIEGLTNQQKAELLTELTKAEQ